MDTGKYRIFLICLVVVLFLIDFFITGYMWDGWIRFAFGFVGAFAIIGFIALFIQTDKINKKLNDFIKEVQHGRH